MNSKKRYEGYLQVDHRASPGLPEEQARRVGLPPGANVGMFEAATIVCSHCQAVVVLNPERARARAYCPKCDHYLCDACGARRAADGGACYPWRQRIEDLQEQAARAQANEAGLIVPPEHNTGS